MPSVLPSSVTSAWRLQDAKSQFGAVVDKALRGVPQHVTRRGQPAVVVVSEDDFEALNRSASPQHAGTLSLVDHLLAMPCGDSLDGMRLEAQPRTVDFS